MLSTEMNENKKARTKKERERKTQKRNARNDQGKLMTAHREAKFLHALREATHTARKLFYEEVEAKL